MISGVTSVKISLRVGVAILRSPEVACGALISSDAFSAAVFLQELGGRDYSEESCRSQLEPDVIYSICAYQK